MGFSTIPVALVALLLAATRVCAHGVADALIHFPDGNLNSGIYYQGYNPADQFAQPPPQRVSWSIPDDLQNTFVAPNAFASPDIVCHLGATPAALHVPVKGGDIVGLVWDTWPDSHKGPVIDYLANCNGPCSQVDKTKLEFFVIQHKAVLDPGADFWAPNQIIRDDLTWFVKIPDTIAPGNYVLRHEIIALHAAGQPNGAQAYPFCFNLAITTSGSENPAGIPAQSFYTATDPGIVWDLFSQKPADYKIPGPELWGGAIDVDQVVGRVVATSTGIASLDLSTLPTPEVVEPEPVSSEPEHTTSEVSVETAISVASSTESSGVATSTSISVIPSSSSLVIEPTTLSTSIISSLSTSSSSSTISSTPSSITPEAVPTPNEGVENANAFVVYSTVFITERVTVVEHAVVTQYTTLPAFNDGAR